MIFHRAIPLFLSALSPLMAADFPMVPGSDRILTLADVKDFWVHSLSVDPLPADSPGADPVQMAAQGAARQREVARRMALTAQIRSGQHDLAARLVCLSHNVAAWNRQGNLTMARETEKRLLHLREHVAKLATLEAQRDAAVKIGEAADKIAARSTEIRQLNALLATLDETA